MWYLSVLERFSAGVNPRPTMGCDMGNTAGDSQRPYGGSEEGRKKPGRANALPSLLYGMM